LDPAAVKVVLGLVADQTEAVSKSLPLEEQREAVHGVEWGYVWTQDVPAALVHLFEDVAIDVESVTNRMVAGVVGVAVATSAYESGAQDMAEIQRQTMDAAQTGNLSWFEHRAGQL